MAPSCEFRTEYSMNTAMMPPMGSSQSASSSSLVRVKLKKTRKLVQAMFGAALLSSSSPS